MIGRLNAGVGEVVGKAVARKTRFRLLNNTTQQSDVSSLGETLVVAIIRFSKQHATMERGWCFTFGPPGVI
jgi:hypothetical protein